MGALIGGGTLDFGQPVHDYAQVSSSGHARCAIPHQKPCMQSCKVHSSRQFCELPSLACIFLQG